ncbi:ankyrin repeat-containing domain protein [Ephemerocybe angulata]|uniref:Ankyrin repeat-containing domain protein n=1 Tax=Ephemerocybe angulata TaxID=980116 RepID=A0A8H6HJN7_9AGAR|nr:ankyrin repeat-containing domain protein [Tulosesus angulatus]
MATAPDQIDWSSYPDTDPTLVQGPHGDANFFQGAENVSVGTMTTTIVSGNYNVTIVNNHPRPESTSCDPAAPFGDIVTWLKAPDFLRIYEEALSQRLSKTGVWFIESEEFRKLVEEREVIVWGTGMPCAGKTLLSSTSMERLREIFAGTNSVAIVCAFIRYTEQPSARDIVAGLLRQLIGSHPCACHNMENLYIQNQKLELREQGLINALREVIGLLSKVFIIIDGLDEAEDAVKDALLRILPTLGANVLIMSRPLELYAHCIPHALHVSIEARTEDIDRFVDDQIRCNSRLQAIVRGDPTLIERLKARIRESSKGMFLVARLQMEAILRKARSANTLLKGLEQLPSGVDAIYEHTLARINAQSEEDASIAHRAFIWLLYVKDSLTSDDLQHTLAISFEDKRYDAGDVIPLDLMLSMCGGLVTVEKRKALPWEWGPDVVRFIHYTAHEYLKKAQFPGLARPHTYLAVSCLVYLENSNLQTCEEGPYFQYFSYDHLSYYADRYWGYHARDSQEEDAEIHPYISMFLQTCGTRYYHYFERGRPGYQLAGLHFAAMYGLVKVITTKCLPFSPGRIWERDLRVWVDGPNPTSLCCHIQRDIIYQLSKLSSNSTPTAYVLSSEINAQNANGETALMLACNISSSIAAVGEIRYIPRPKEQQEKVLKILAERRDVEVDIQDIRGRTAFMRTCMESRDHTIPLALMSMRPEINVNIKDNNGITALMYAARSGLHQTVAYLLDQNHQRRVIDIDEVDNTGQTALIHFCASDCRVGIYWTGHEITDFLNLLARHGCNLHVRDRRNDRSAFLWAAASNDGKYDGKKSPATYILEYFLSIPFFDCNQRDNIGRTALMLAAASFSMDAFETLLFHPRTDVNAQDAEGRTVLHWCCKSGMPEALEMLISHPALNLRLLDNRGWSALDQASWRWGWPGVEVVSILAGSGHWEESAIRKAVIQFFAGQCDCGISHKATLIILPLSPSTFKAFKWTSDDPMTWVLLGYALRDDCKVAAVMILINCGFLPLLNLTAEEGKKYCKCYGQSCLDRYW